MSKLKLGNIDIYDVQSNVPSFIIGDVIDGGGYEDPAIVYNLDELRRRFRYAKHYKEYQQLIINGATLALAGNKKKFNDIPTIVVFNQNPRFELGTRMVSYANPSYDDMFKSIEELASELQTESKILSNALFLTLSTDRTSYEKFKLNEGDGDFVKYYRIHSAVKATVESVVESLKNYDGDNLGNDYTYKINIKPNVTNLASKLVEGIKNGDIYTLVLPRKVNSDDEISTTYEFHDYGILFQYNDNGKVIPSRTNISLSVRGDNDSAVSVLDGYIGRIILNGNETNEEILQKIVDCVAPDSGQVLTDIYYASGERLYINDDDPNHPYLVLETPYLIRAYDFCYSFCKLFDYVSDAEFTQKILFARGLINQGVVLSAYSQIYNKEGRNIDLVYSCDNDWMNLVIDFLDSSNEYLGDNLMNEVKDNDLLTFTNINYSTRNYDGVTLPSFVNKGVYQTDSYGDDSYDIRSTYLAYESFFEYEIPVSVILAPHNPKEWYSSPIPSILRKFTYSHNRGGMDSTILIQLNSEDENEGQLIYTLGNRLAVSDSQVYWFSGGFLYESMYQYLIKFLRDKSFTADNGSEVMKSLPDKYKTLTLKHNGYEVEYDNNPWKFVVSLGISHVLNSAFSAVTPGTSFNIARTKIEDACVEALSFNPLLDSVNINSIEHDDNTLIINLDIYYRSLSDVEKVNFKIYRSYGKTN